MNTHEQIDRLAGQLRWLKVYCTVMTMALVILLLGAAARVNTFDELTVQRLNIVDPAGKPRLVLANMERFPAPVINGKTLKRAVNPAGFVFFNGKGDEVGGLALTDLEGGRLSALVFDYPQSDAIGLLTRISPDGKDSTAGIVINSNMKNPSKRIELQNHNEVPELVLSDSKGRPRLRLFVDEGDHPSIEMLDEAGASVYSLRR